MRFVELVVGVDVDAEVSLRRGDWEWELEKDGVENGVLRRLVRLRFVADTGSRDV